MIIYNVTINVDKDIENEFITWLREIHIPEVFETQLFLAHKLLKMVEEENPASTTYAVQYSMESIDKFVEYVENHAPSLQAKTKKKYGDKVVAFRTLLEVVE